MWFLLGALAAVLFVACGLWLMFALGPFGLALWLIAFAAIYLAYHALMRRLGAD